VAELRFCPAGEPDIPVIFDLCRVLILRYEDPAAVDLEKVLAWTQGKVRENIREYTCVRLDGRTVGYYRLAPAEGMTELDDFYILPELRGQGIGTRVLEKLCRETAGPLFLYVFTQNTGAVRLYERFGFRKVKAVSHTRMILQRGE